jgi:hypothetical protein
MVLLWSARRILSLAHIVNERLQSFLVVDVPPASALCPPVLANGRVGLGMTGGRAHLCLIPLFQASGAPRFELLASLVRIAIRRDHHMDVVRSAVDGVESPAANTAVVRDRRFDQPALLVVEPTRRFRHACRRLALDDRIRQPHSHAVLNPTTLVAGQPCSVSRPGQKERERLRQGWFKFAASFLLATWAHRSVLRQVSETALLRIMLTHDRV